MPPRRRGDSPASVAIVANGPSKAHYAALVTAKGNRAALAEECWALNGGMSCFQFDRGFMMDDLALLRQGARKGNAYYAQLLATAKQAKAPVYLSTAYPSLCPAGVEYPLADVIRSLKGCAYFTTTLAYAIGLAIMERVGCIKLYGCDFSYPGVVSSEGGRACVEFLLGMAADRGIEVEASEHSTLLDANDGRRRFYGYGVEIEVSGRGPKSLKVARGAARPKLV